MPPLIRSGTLDLADHPLECGLVRLAVLGSDGFRMVFDDPEVMAAIEAVLAEPGEDPTFDQDRLRPVAAAGLDELERGAATDERLARLLAIWRPRALRLAGRGRELGGDDALRLRLEDRLAEIVAAMEQARDGGDADLAERLHARYIELGTTYAARMAKTWEAVSTS